MKQINASFLSCVSAYSKTAADAKTVTDEAGKFATLGELLMYDAYKTTDGPHTNNLLYSIMYDANGTPRTLEEANKRYNDLVTAAPVDANGKYTQASVKAALDVINAPKADVTDAGAGGAGGAPPQQQQPAQTGAWTVAEWRTEVAKIIADPTTYPDFAALSTAIETIAPGSLDNYKKMVNGKNYQAPGVKTTPEVNAIYEFAAVVELNVPGTLANLDQKVKDMINTKTGLSVETIAADMKTMRDAIAKAKNQPSQ